MKYCDVGQVQSCKACTSEDGDNVVCEEDPESLPSTECKMEYGDDFCYVMLTRDMLGPDGDIWRWNRKIKLRNKDPYLWSSSHI